MSQNKSLSNCQVLFLILSWPSVNFFFFNSSQFYWIHFTTQKWAITIVLKNTGLDNDWACIHFLNHTCTRTRTHISIYINIYTCICMHTQYTRTYTRIHNTCIYTHIYTLTYTYIQYAHIHTHTPSLYPFSTSEETTHYQVTKMVYHGNRTELFCWV